MAVPVRMTSRLHRPLALLHSLQPLGRLGWVDRRVEHPHAAPSAAVLAPRSALHPPPPPRQTHRHRHRHQQSPSCRRRRCSGRGHVPSPLPAVASVVLSAAASRQIARQRSSAGSGRTRPLPLASRSQSSAPRTRRLRPPQLPPARRRSCSYVSHRCSASSFSSAA